MKNYCFDIDGTVCNNTWGKYEEAVPIDERISIVNRLYDEGNYITYFTARGMGTCKGDSFKAHEIWYNFTLRQLESWGCKFNQLILGKPNADYYIDDKGISDEDFFGKICP